MFETDEIRKLEFLIYIHAFQPIIWTPNDRELVPWNLPLSAEQPNMSTWAHFYAGTIAGMKKKKKR
jgi:hypothetical protein